MIKNPLTVQETWVQSWIGKIPWRRTWQPTPVFLLGESLWTEEPGGLQSMRSQRVGHDWATKYSTHSNSIFVSKQSQSNIEAKQDPLGPSQVQKSIHAPHFLFVEKGFTLLGPPWDPKSRLNQLGNWGTAEAKSQARKVMIGTSLAVQWWGACLALQGIQFQSLVGKLRCHLPQSN